MYWWLWGLPIFILYYYNYTIIKYIFFDKLVYILTVVWIVKLNYLLPISMKNMINQFSVSFMLLHHEFQVNCTETNLNFLHLPFTSINTELHSLEWVNWFNLSDWIAARYEFHNFSLRVSTVRDHLFKPSSIEMIDIYTLLYVSRYVVVNARKQGPVRLENFH